MVKAVGGESTAGDGIRAERGVEGHLVCAERVGGMATMAELDAAGEGKRANTAATIWSKFIEIYGGDLGECELPDAHECVGRGEQQDQSDKAYGIWI